MGIFLILDGWTVFQDFTGLAGRFLSIFHLQTAVLHTTICCPGLEGHGISINKNTKNKNNFQQTKKKSYFTWNLKSKIKGSSYWAQPFHLEISKVNALGETETSTATWSCTDMTINQIPAQTQDTHLQKHSSEWKYKLKASHTNTCSGFVMKAGS